MTAVVGTEKLDLNMADVHALSDQHLVERFTFLEEVRCHRPRPCTRRPTLRSSPARRPLLRVFFAPDRLPARIMCAVLTRRDAL